MAQIRSKDTKPEMIVRRYLHSKGYRYRKNVKSLPGTPDIVLRKYGVAIFIHGCFWHGHATHMRMPKTNREFWETKIMRNRQRDEISKEKLRRMGWSVMTVWECQLSPHLRKRTLAEIERLINANFLNRLRPHSPATPQLPYSIPADAPAIAAESDTEYGKKD